MKFWLVRYQVLMIIVWPYLQKSLLLTNWQWKVWRGRERGNVWQLRTWQMRHRWTNCTSIPSPCSLRPLPVGAPFQACVGWRFPAVMPKVLPSEPGVGLNIAMHALPTARNFFLLVLFSIVLVHSPSFFLLQWGTADAEIRVPSDLTNVLTLKVCSRSEYSRHAFPTARNIFLVLISTILVHSTYFFHPILSLFFNCIIASTVSHEDLQNKIGCS